MKNTFFIFSLFFSLLLCSSLFFSCKSSKQDNSFELKYSKSACKGRCPVFTLKIDGDQMIVFNGKQYTSVVGLIQMKLPDDAYKELQDLISESKFLETDAVGFNRPFDIPMTILEITKGKSTKKQIFYNETPQDLENLVKFLDKLVIEIQSESRKR